MNQTGTNASRRGGAIRTASAAILAAFSIAQTAFAQCEYEVLAPSERTYTRFDLNESAWTPRLKVVDGLMATNSSNVGNEDIDHWEETGTTGESGSTSE